MAHTWYSDLHVCVLVMQRERPGLFLNLTSVQCYITSVQCYITTYYMDDDTLILDEHIIVLREVISKDVHVHSSVVKLISGPYLYVEYHV